MDILTNPFFGLCDSTGFQRWRKEADDSAGMKGLEAAVGNKSKGNLATQQSDRRGGGRRKGGSLCMLGIDPEIESSPVYGTPPVLQVPEKRKNPFRRRPFECESRREEKRWRLESSPSPFHIKADRRSSSELKVSGMGARIIRPFSLLSLLSAPSPCLTNSSSAVPLPLPLCAFLLPCSLTTQLLSAACISSPLFLFPARGGRFLSREGKKKRARFDHRH